MIIMMMTKNDNEYDGVTCAGDMTDDDYCYSARRC